ncbi:GGDEF domain-containing protein [Polycladidibacter hongkongensis]|uniref:GGDEF domain-containing protein n=1 Tax=Polycladidibacter hongkongensis TaxID=1647556 RepID=UPI000833E174|nr:GGDEF domain-containing protein [Pseudovibrio hongkongensis]
MTKKDDYQRTITYGDSALNYIKSNRLPAFPRNYELWYSYASGFNLSLNRSINKVLSRDGSISSDEVERIYNRFLSPNRLGERIDEVGEKIAKEVRQLAHNLDHGNLITEEYGARLAKALQELNGITGQEALQKLILDLIKVTTETVESNRQLKNELMSSRRQIGVLQEGLEAIRYESLTDELTTLNNRKHFDKSLEKHVKEARSSDVPLALMLTDIDHFKQFNDNFGHQTGDQVLRLVALAVKKNVKSSDITCRYGGEEFGIILPRTSNEEALDIAEQIRRAVISKELIKRSTGENLGRITISIGVAFHKSGDTPMSLVNRADQALYAAKRAGRNQVKQETLPDEPDITVTMS